MELISIERSKLVSLFFVSNSQGQPLLDQIASAIVARYQFATFPTKIEELSSDKITFSHGNFNNKRIDHVEVFSDGIIVTAKSNSQVVEDFLSDLLSFTESEFGLKRVESHTYNKIFESQLIFKTEKRILGLLDGFKNIELTLNAMLKSTTNSNIQMEHFGFSIAADNTTISGLKPIVFRLERKQDASFDSNLYFAAAPLKTDDHIKILEQIESMS